MASLLVQTPTVLSIQLLTCDIFLYLSRLSGKILKQSAWLKLLKVREYIKLSTLWLVIVHQETSRGCLGRTWETSSQDGEGIHEQSAG